MDQLIGPNTCWDCGGDYGEHSRSCRTRIQQEYEEKKPRRFRIRLGIDENHPNGTEHPYRYGCYFPLTDLVVGDMGGRGTGRPTGVEWIDD